MLLLTPTMLGSLLTESLSGLTSGWPVIQEEQSRAAVVTDAACSIPPRAPHAVTRDCGSILLAGGEQFPSNQPTHCSLG